MPTQGPFSASLVDATHRTILQERVDASGTTWVMGEPGDEFFVAVVQEEHVPCAVKTYVAVDGVDIGYSLLFPCTAPCELPWMGPMKSGQTWSEGALVTHAFKFVRHDVKGALREQDEVTGERRVPPAGSVTVRLVRTIKTDRPVAEFALSTWTGPSLASYRETHRKKEQSALRATTGCAVRTIGCAALLHYEDQEELARLTIRYTTDFGIAVRGLYTREEANGTQQPPSKRVRREQRAPTGASTEDAIVL